MVGLPDLTRKLVLDPTRVSGRDRDRGAGTVVVVGLVAFVVGLAALIAPVAALASARHRAAAAADAAALAGAAIAAGLAGLGDPCAVAESLAARHDAILERCKLEGLVVTVRAAVGTAFGPVSATATAGPAGGPGGWTAG